MAQNCREWLYLTITNLKNTKMKKSEFKRLTKVEKGLPKSGEKFLVESKVFIKGTSLIAGWYKGDIARTNEYVVVLQNEEGEYLVLSRKNGEIEIEVCETLYQTFLAHKAARFA